jgi:uncharacterized protein (DUF1800 family)
LSPAMGFYLDMVNNDKPYPKRGNTPNENYAREVMELHTLSVNGGYTQNDVMQLARCLTGWTIKEHFWRGEFTFDPALHDNGEKNILGMTVQPSGQGEAESIFAQLSAHPSTAHFLGLKLARRFISETPPDDLVSKAANTFIQTHGDIRATLRVILLDGAGFIGPKFKRPSDFVGSALRLLDAKTDAGVHMHEYLARMGQPYFAWPTPDGFPDRSETWMGNLVPRWQFALAIARNEIDGTTIDIASLANQGEGIKTNLDLMSQLLLGGTLPPYASANLAASLRNAGAPDSNGATPIIIAGLLASPAFQWK